LLIVIVTLTRAISTYLILLCYVHLQYDIPTCPLDYCSGNGILLKQVVLMEGDP